MPSIQVTSVDWSGLSAQTYTSNVSSAPKQWNAYYSSDFSGLSQLKMLTDASSVQAQWNA